MKNVFLAVPTEDGWIHGLTAKRLSETRLDWELVSTVRPCDAARNEVGRRFEKSGKEWLVMVDADTVPAQGFLEKLCGDRRRTFVGSPYTMLTHSGEWHLCIGKKNSAGSYNWARFMEAEGWQQWDAIGFGCVAIHRSLMEKNFTPFEPWITEPGRVFTEDVLFCEKCPEKPWTHPDLIADHFREINLAIAHNRLVMVAKHLIEY